jgi:hypothetical protein
MAEHLTDDRRGKNSQLPLPDLITSSSVDSASKRPTTSRAGEKGCTMAAVFEVKKEVPG